MGSSTSEKQPIVPFNISRLGKEVKIGDLYMVADYCSNCDSIRWIEIEIETNRNGETKVGCCRVCGKIAWS